MTKNYKEIILKLKNELYSNAKTIFWASSIANNEFTKGILDPFGGFLWNGFRFDSPKEWKR